VLGWSTGRIEFGRARLMLPGTIQAMRMAPMAGDCVAAPLISGLDSASPGRGWAPGFDKRLRFNVTVQRLPRLSCMVDGSVGDWDLR
jgi:hypothetical protein